MKYHIADLSDHSSLLKSTVNLPIRAKKKTERSAEYKSLLSKRAGCTSLETSKSSTRRPLLLIALRAKIVLQNGECPANPTAPIWVIRPHGKFGHNSRRSF